MRRYLLYLLRWQLSTPILALVMCMVPLPVWPQTVIANLAGGLIFYWVDRLIFRRDGP